MLGQLKHWKSDKRYNGTERHNKFINFRKPIYPRKFVRLNSEDFAIVFLEFDPFCGVSRKYCSSAFRSLGWDSLSLLYTAVSFSMVNTLSSLFFLFMTTVGHPLFAGRILISLLAINCFSAWSLDGERLGVKRGCLFNIPTMLDQALDTELKLAFENFRTVSTFTIKYILTNILK